MGPERYRSLKDYYFTTGASREGGLGQEVAQQLVVLPLGAEEEINHLANGALAAAGAGDVVSALAGFRVGVGHRHRQADAGEERQVGDVVADEADLLVTDAAGPTNSLVGRQLLEGVLLDKIHL